MKTLYNSLWNGLVRIAKPILISSLLIVPTQTILNADDSPTQPSTQASQAPITTNEAPSLSPNGRSNVINFEDEIVNGMNKNPFDSLTNIEKNNEKKLGHLYKKKSNFNYEIKMTVREMGLTQ